MPRDFTLYWSSLARFEKCPQQFLWSRGWGAIDVGGGPGRKKPVPLQDSRHHAVMGIVIAAVIEDFYNEELWKHSNGLKQRLLRLTEEKFKFEVARNYIDWRLAGPKDDLLAICTSGVINFVFRTLKTHKFLGPYARSEVDLVAYLDKWNPVGGRADIIFRRDDTGITILDGKNSKEHWDRRNKRPKFYTDPDQLRWYALCFFQAYGKMPARLGFAYFRYPQGYTWEAEIERLREEQKQYAWKSVVIDFYEQRGAAEGVTWVEYTKDDLKGLAVRAVEARKGMNKERFIPTPEPSNCRFCDYETVCDARQAQKESNRLRKKQSDPVLDAAAGQGFVRFGMDRKGGTVRLD